MSKQGKKAVDPRDTEVGGGPPPPTDDRSFKHRVKKPAAKDKSAKTAALDVTASPGVDDRDKQR